jgi:hypothetical protein
MMAWALESAVWTTQSCGSAASLCDSVAVLSLAAAGHVMSVVAYQGCDGAGAAEALTSLA